MRIEFMLAPKDPRDPLDIDPVGDIYLISDAQILAEKDVYLDSWMNALVEGSTKLATVDWIEIDLIEERDPLVFERRNLGVRIGFRGKSITAPDLNDLVNAVRAAIQAYTLISNEQPSE